MNANDLLDESALDPKKLFNEEEYSTLIVSRDGFSKRDNDVTDLMLTLLDKKNSRTECEDIYKQLKDLNSPRLMLNVIQTSKKDKDTTALVSACWETGLDFTPHFTEFVQLACNTNFNLAFEALTVIQECTGKVDKSAIEMANDLINRCSSPHKAILDDLHQNLAQKSNE